MAVPVLQILQVNTDNLQEQLEVCTGVTGKLREIVMTFLVNRGICSLYDVTLEDMDAYREMIAKLSGIKDSQRKYYGNLLEQAVFAYLASTDDKLVAQAKKCIPNRALRNKTVGFLLLIGISDAADICYKNRACYEKYLTRTIAPSKVSEYIKAMDLLKLNSIRIQNEANRLKEYKLEYSKNQELFLLYHPSYKDCVNSFV